MSRLLQLAEPFDGMERGELITPLLAQHIQRAYNAVVVSQCGRSAGPKYGQNLLGIAQTINALGAPFLHQNEVRGFQCCSVVISFKCRMYCVIVIPVFLHEHVVCGVILQSQDSILCAAALVFPLYFCFKLGLPCPCLSVLRYCRGLRRYMPRWRFAYCSTFKN